MSETMTEVKKIISRFAKNKEALEQATGETRIQKDLGVSSMNLVDIVLEFEAEFDISIADEDLANIVTLGNAVDLIESKKKAPVN